MFERLIWGLFDLTGRISLIEKSDFPSVELSKSLRNPFSLIEIKLVISAIFNRRNASVHTHTHTQFNRIPVYKLFLAKSASRTSLRIRPSSFGEQWLLTTE